MISFKKNYIKFILIAVAASFIILLGYRSINIILKGRKKSRTLEYAVEIKELKKETVKQKLLFKGIVEGDPQVKVHSNISGKFITNSVEVGSFVYKDQVIVLIDRNMVGDDYYNPNGIKSPISGVVKKFYFSDAGTFIGNNSVVAEVANINNIKTMLDIGEEYLLKLKKGMPALIYSIYDKEQKLDGTVTSVTPFIDSDTFTGTLEIKAKNTNNTLKLGMSVNINIYIGDINAFMVPQSAITVGLNTQYVFINKNGIAKMTPVDLGYIDEDRIEIKGNISENEQVVVNGGFKLYDGAKIKVIK